MTELQKTGAAVHPFSVQTRHLFEADVLASHHNQVSPAMLTPNSKSDSGKKEAPAAWQRTEKGAENSHIAV